MTEWGNMTRIIKFIAAIVFTTSSIAAEAVTYTADFKTVKSIFGIAQGGDRINLIGEFGLTQLINRSFASAVTIDASAATFTDTLYIRNVSRIQVMNGQFGSANSFTRYNKGVAIYGGSNITFIDPSVVGYFGGYGIAFDGTTDATVQGGNFSKLRSGVLMYRVNKGNILQNNSIASVNDGFNIADSSNILIEGNRCTGSTPLVGNHPDCVQFWNSAGMPVMHDIMIRNNYASGMTQGFNNFGSSPGSTRISFIDNRVDGMFPQGLYCGSCMDSVITGNIMSTMDGAPWRVSIRTPNNVNTLIANNTVGALNRAAARTLTYYTRQQLIDRDVLTTAAAAAVPEPSVWGMLVTGFGLVGATLRGRSVAVQARNRSA